MADGSGGVNRPMFRDVSVLVSLFVLYGVEFVLGCVVVLVSQVGCSKWSVVWCVFFSRILGGMVSEYGSDSGSGLILYVSSHFSSMSRYVLGVGYWVFWGRVLVLDVVSLFWCCGSSGWFLVCADGGSRV